MSPFRVPKNFDPDEFPEFMNPELMIIGDSLANGVQSLTIDERRAKLGPGNVVARGLGIQNYRYPAYPDVLLIDAKDVLDDLSLLNLVKKVKDALRSLKDNATGWLDRLEKQGDGSRFWDGLGLGGAVSDDLINKTYGDWRADIAALEDMVRQKPAKDWDLDLEDFIQKVLAHPSTSDWYRSQIEQMTPENQELSTLRILHYAFNACFLINPDNLPGFERMRFIDMIALRQPKRLVVLNGPNHGLFEYTLRGRPMKGEAGIGDYVENPSQLDALLDLLTALPKTVQKIVLSTMPLPSQTPNLMPRVDKDDFSLPKRPPGVRYYDEYRPYLFMTKEGLDWWSGEQVETFDQEVGGLCDTIVQKAEARGGRIIALPLHQILDKFDAKHHPGRTLKVRPPHAHEGKAVSYSNRALQRHRPASNLWNPVLKGGLATLDNHHPSTVGYQQFGNEILRVLREGSPVPLDNRDDPLLTDPPVKYFWLMRVWREVGPILLETDTISTLRDRHSPDTALPDRLDDENIDAIVDELIENEGLRNRAGLRAVVVLLSLFNDLID